LQGVSFSTLSQPKKKILLIDLDDMRRRTRVAMLAKAGYDTDVHLDDIAVRGPKSEATFDLVIISLHQDKLDRAAAYSEWLRKANPDLPILLLMDAGVFVPHGTLSRSIETGFPFEMMRHIAEMLAGSAHIRELQSNGASA
jgi:AmiR/NasT family two-component response regulator